MVNTLLANVTDTVSSGTDIVHIVATDSSGNTVVRDVGVQTATPVAPPTVTPGTAGGQPALRLHRRHARAWSGQGQAANLDVAGQLGNSGILLVAGVQSQLSLAGDLDAQRQHVVAGGAVAQRLQHREPHDRRRLLGRDRQQHVLLGHARAANAINNTGGTIRGNGTLDATGGTSIANTGTIEAVADFTLGSQRLVVADNLHGHRQRCTIDAGATLVLNGTVHDQTITFVANTATSSSRSIPIRRARWCWTSRAALPASSIEGFTFADRLVLENVTLSTTAATPVAY